MGYYISLLVLFLLDIYGAIHLFPMLPKVPTVFLNGYVKFKIYHVMFTIVTSTFHWLIISILALGTISHLFC